MSGDRPRVLLLGVDPPTLQASVTLGIDVVVVEGAYMRDYGWSGIPDSIPVLFVEDPGSVEGIYAILERSGHARARFDAVTTSNESLLLAAAVTAEIVGARGHAPRTALFYRDKALQKRRIRAAGLPTARSFVIEDIRRPGNLSYVDFDEAVLKPIAGAGSHFTRRVSSTAEVPGVLAELARSARCPRTFLIEEYVAGAEWHADGVVFGGEVHFVSLTRHGQPCLDALTENRPRRYITLDPVDDRSAYELVVPTVDAALAALGPLDGVFHLEVFVDGETVTFGECAARPGGAYIRDYVQLKQGVNLAAAALEASIGRQPSLSVVRNPRSVGCTHLAAPAGLLLGAPTADQVAARAGVERAWVSAPVGHVGPDTHSRTVMSVGAACVSAPTVELLESGLDDLVSWFSGQVSVAPRDATPADLRLLEVGATAPVARSSSPC